MRPVEPRPVRRRQDRVAGQRQQRPDLPVARRLDLLAQRGDRQLAGELRQPADAAAPQVVVPAADQPGADRVDGRRGEHRAADAVEVAGQQVEQLDRPLADGAERVRRDPDPAVGHGAVGRRELAGDPADLLGGHAAARPRRARG